MISSAGTSVYFFGFASPDNGEHIEINDASRFTGRPILTVNTAGDFARTLDALTADRAAARVMPSLRRMFGSSIPGPAERQQGHRHSPSG